MNRKYVASAITALAFAGLSHADEMAAPSFSIVGPTGSIYQVVQTRGDMQAGRPIAAMLIRRQSGSSMLMETVFDCDQRRYAYLAMDYSPDLPVTPAALDVLGQQSDLILTTNLSGTTFTPMTDDPYDVHLYILADYVCSAD